MTILTPRDAAVRPAFNWALELAPLCAAPAGPQADAGASGAARPPAPPSETVSEPADGVVTAPCDRRGPSSTTGARPDAPAVEFVPALAFGVRWPEAEPTGEAARSGGAPAQPVASAPDAPSRAKNADAAGPIRVMHNDTPDSEATGGKDGGMPQSVSAASEPPADPRERQSGAGRPPARRRLWSGSRDRTVATRMPDGLRRMALLVTSPFRLPAKIRPHPPTLAAR